MPEEILSSAPAMLLAALASTVALGAQPSIAGSWLPPFDHRGPFSCDEQAGGTFNAIHMALIPKGRHRGKVFVMNRPGVGWVHQPWAIVDPATGRCINRCLAIGSNQEGQPGGYGDLFCSAHSWTRDGNLFIAGGTLYTPAVGYADHGSAGFDGPTLTYIWDPARWNADNQGWFKQANELEQRRYYPSTTVLADDSIMVTGGLDHGANLPLMPSTYEVFELTTPTSGRYVTAPGGSQIYQGPDQTPAVPPIPTGTFLWYPRLHLLSAGSTPPTGSSGRVFMSGFALNGASAHHVDAAVGGATAWNYAVGVFNGRPGASSALGPCGPVAPYLVPPQYYYHHYGSSLLLPIDVTAPATWNRVLRLGGGYDFGVLTSNTTPTDTIEVWEDGVAGSAWQSALTESGQATAFLAERRMHCTAVLLPDDTVFVLGGDCRYVLPPAYPAPSEQPLSTELFEVSRPGRTLNGHRAGASQASGRGYHSTAVLLPDARVLVGGGDTRTVDYQIYEPPYLHQGLPQPAAPVVRERITRGVEYAVTCDPDHRIDHLVLIRPGSITHHSDFDARTLRPAPSTSLALKPGQVGFVAPVDPDLAPAGYYMLFAITDAGVPSRAAWVLLR